MANKLNLSNEDIALLLSDQLIILENGLIYRDEQGLPHREDGPASISLNGNYWYRHGLLHREDGPAVEYVDGSTEHWINGRITDVTFTQRRALKEIWWRVKVAIKRRWISICGK